MKRLKSSYTNFIIEQNIKRNSTEIAPETSIQTANKIGSDNRNYHYLSEHNNYYLKSDKNPKETSNEINIITPRTFQINKEELFNNIQSKNIIQKMPEIHKISYEKNFLQQFQNKFVKKISLEDQIINLSPIVLKRLATRYSEYFHTKFENSARIRKSGSLKDIIKVNVSKKKSLTGEKYDILRCIEMAKTSKNLPEKNQFPLKERKRNSSQILIPQTSLSSTNNINFFSNNLPNNNFYKKSNETLKSLKPLESLKSFKSLNSIKNIRISTISEPKSETQRILKKQMRNKINQKNIDRYIVNRRVRDLENIFKDNYGFFFETTKKEFEIFSRENFGAINRKRIERELNEEKKKNMRDKMKISKYNEIRLELMRKKGLFNFKIKNPILFKL